MLDNFNDSQTKKSSWNKSHTILSLNLSNFYSGEKETMSDENCSSSNCNSSTLSLHISAYENSFGGGKDLVKNVKQISVGPTLINQNYFEFPRQQENEKVMEPQVISFKASQKLYNPNESNTTKRFSKFKILNPIYPTSSTESSLNHKENVPPLYLPSIDSEEIEIKSEMSEDFFDNVADQMEKSSNSLPSLSSSSSIITPQPSTTPSSLIPIINVATIIIQKLSNATEEETPSESTRKFFTAPGYVGPFEEDASKIENLCTICNFSCSSKFHFISHMNTHESRQCLMCDYTTRTEGRLKKHMKESHTKEEQISVGLNNPEVDSEAAASISEMHPPTFETLIEEVNNVASDSPTSSSSLQATNSSFRPKTKFSSRKKGEYHCKECGHISLTKEQSWNHNKSHIPLNKQLSCLNCSFVTELKHHLEYHVRSHFGIKPFKCSKCNYSCSTQSMLNSHMKSHSSEYQFSCGDCSYQTKYFHSFTQHSKKYGHHGKIQINGDSVEEEATSTTMEQINN
uniref:C2H2-type domain-containing protein n=1 Tax=Panagrolaimus davidi TaxID=227884 RepID=A0A914QDR0_9BILA